MTKMKLSLVNEWTIRDLGNEILEEVLDKTKDQAKRRMIEQELDRRKQLGVNRPLTLEDYLG